MRNKSQSEIEAPPPWPKVICTYCDNFHCGVCRGEMGMVEHGAAICHKREAKSIQRYIERDQMDIVKSCLQRLDANGHLDAVEDELRKLFPDWDKIDAKQK